MNQKKTKALRRIIPLWRDVEYKERKFAELLLPVPHLRVYPIRRVENCGRTAYQAAKKAMQAHLHGARPH